MIAVLVSFFLGIIFGRYETLRQEKCKILSTLKIQNETP